MEDNKVELGEPRLSPTMDCPETKAETENTLISSLDHAAMLQHFAYDRCREAEADHLGICISCLDEEVESDMAEEDRTKHVNEAVEHGHVLFRQRDVTAAMKGVLDTGYSVSRTEISPEGHLVIVPGPPISPAHSPTEIPPLASRPIITMKFLFENFGQISAVVITVGIAGSITFLFSYLSVFDWRLMWLMEYTDVIKFALFLAALASGLSYAIQAIAINIDLVRDSRTFLYASVGGFLLLLIGTYVYLIIYHIPRTTYMSFIGSLTLLATLGFIVYKLALRKLVSLWSLLWITLFILFTISTIAQTVAYVVRQSKDTYNIMAKTGNLGNAKIIMVSTSYLIVMVYDRIVVLPATDLISITSDKELDVLP